MAGNGPGYGRTYGEALDAVAAAVVQAGQVAVETPFRDRAEAAAAAVAFERLQRVLARHVRFLVGPTPRRTRNPRTWAARQLADTLEAATRPVRLMADRSVGTHPAARAWTTSADALALANDILASHLDPDRVPLTPDGDLLLNADAAWRAVLRLAELTMTVDTHREILLHRLDDTLPAPGTREQVAMHRARLSSAAGAPYAAAMALDAARVLPGWPELDRVSLAPVSGVTRLPDDPVDRAVQLVDSLRRFVYDQARTGAGIGADGLRSYAALGVDITIHTGVILRATRERAPDLFGRQVGSDIISSALDRAVRASSEMGRQWAQVYRRWDDCTSLDPTPLAVPSHVRSARQALSAVTRDGGGWKPSPQLLPDADAAVHLLAATNQLVGPLGPLANRQLAIVQHAKAARRLLAPNERLPEHARGTGPWHQHFTPLPGFAYGAVVSAYRQAGTASSEAASTLDHTVGAITTFARVSHALAAAHRPAPPSGPELGL
jgi:hypothetical protein